MKGIAAISLVLSLVACSQDTSEPFDISKEGIGKLPGCPTLPGVGSVRITAKDGPDFRFCKATHAKTGKPLFEVYVGEHPPNPERGLRYGGTTAADRKTLVWFTTPTGGWGTPRIWYTYLPTGSPRGTVMVVTIVTHRAGDLERITPLIAHLTPSR